MVTRQIINTNSKILVLSFPQSVMHYFHAQSLQYQFIYYHVVFLSGLREQLNEVINLLL